LLNISVIIPSYNRKHTLSRAIKSVLNQTYNASEIILVDDGSIDETKPWVLGNFPMVKYLSQLRNGVSAARNKGIEHSKNNWISLLDSDDEWLPEKLEEQVQQIKEDKSSLFSHTNEIWIRNGVRVNQMKKHQKYGGQIFNKCLDICRVSPSSVLLHKKVLQDVGLFDEKLEVCEDYDLWLRISAKYPVLFLDRPLIVKYGGHEDQLSKVKNGIEQFRIQSLEKILSRKLLNENQFSLMKKMLIKKLEIYSNGLKKRNKMNEFLEIEKKITRWTIMSYYS
jgi:glycosyltransferase involved in cell wall biosynthesis